MRRGGGPKATGTPVSPDEARVTVGFIACCFRGHRCTHRALLTIAVAIRTGSAVVFAADSKVTTRGVIGLDGKGVPVWVEQTYDNANKVVHDRTARVMAMVAGAANIGRTSATDFISTLSMGGFHQAPS